MNCLQNSEEYNHELKYIITLDGGTTNTRAYLWKQDGSFVSSKKERAGVRNTAMDGSDQVIRETVKRCIDGLIEESHIEESQVQGIFCSGMLTSNVGLEEIPYLCAPVDERALCNAIECRFFNDITRIPFYMIPGVRNHVGEYRNRYAGADGCYAWRRNRGGGFVEGAWQGRGSDFCFTRLPY